MQRLLSFGLISIFLTGCNFAEKGTRSTVCEAGISPRPISIPVNQVLTPAGTQIELPGTRPQVLAVSPDGRLLATSGKHQLILIDPRDGKILQTVSLPL